MSQTWTGQRIVVGSLGGLLLAIGMDVGAAKTDLEFCLGLGTGAMLGVVIAVYSDLDLFRAVRWRQPPQCPQHDALWDREQDG